MMTDGLLTDATLLSASFGYSFVDLVQFMIIRELYVIFHHLDNFFPFLSYWVKILVEESGGVYVGALKL